MTPSLSPTQLARQARKLDEREWCLFHNSFGQHIGSNILEARGWLEEHPEYQGPIYGDWDTGGPRDNFDATEMFFPDAEEAPATIAENATEHKALRPGEAAQRNLMTQLFQDLARSISPDRAA